MVQKKTTIYEITRKAGGSAAAIVRDATLIIRESCGSKLGWRER